MKRSAAFSLIEVMCAVAILGIAMVGLTHGITTALTASKESELQTAAALIAAGRLETLRADGFIEEGTDEEAMTGELAIYRWKQAVTETSTRGLFEVVVRVEHTRTDKLIYELRTMLFDPPPDFIPESARKENDRDKGRRERRPR